MARKSKEQIKEEKSAKLSAIITIAVSSLLLVVALSKAGTVGTVCSNILSFIFGKFYAVLLVTSIIIGLASLLGHKFSVLFNIGLILFNISVILLSGFIFNKDAANFDAYLAFIADGFKAIFTTSPVDYGSGIIGYGLFTLCVVAIDIKLTLVFIILGIIVSVAFLIPKQWYTDMITNAKEQRAIRKEERRIEREEREKQEAEEELLRQQQEEEERLRLAEEINAQNDELIEEEEMMEVEQEPPLDMSSHSSAFIDMYSSKSTQVTYPEEETESPGINILTEPTIKKGKPHRVIAKKGIYHLPNDKLLEPKSTIKKSTLNVNNAEQKGNRAIEVLKTFDINAALVNTYIGPSVTKFEIKPDSTIKVNKIAALQDNLMLELAVKNIRLEVPIPGKNAIGIEIPNAEITPVKMIELLPGIKKNNSNTTFALGKNLLGDNVYCDIRKTPHLLIAGATGSGKSVCENAIITSILMRSHPDDVKLVLIDPKKVEFTPYHNVPHLLWPVITDAKMATILLEKIVVIMEQRYEQFSKTGTKNLELYNEYVANYNSKLKADQVPMDKMPYIIIIIDELADLMATSKNEVIGSIQRITQLARASGIHLVVATQRPSADIITGVIKNNIPSRIAFAMPTSIDSRTIIDQVGAEKLLGNGDMLYHLQSDPAPIRLQGVYVTDKEISNIASYVKSQAEPNYDDTYYTILNNNSSSGGSSSMATNEVDPLYDEVVEFVRSAQKASTSLLQRRFGIGFNRAARIIDTLEEKHIIGPQNGSKPREVLLKPNEDSED